MAEYQESGDGKETPKRKGRSPGSTNRQYDVVEVESTKCAKCSSPDRTKYEGNPETHRITYSDCVVVTTWRRTRCLGCGQWRKDKSKHRESI